MKLRYLFPHRFKKMGLYVFIPTAIIGLITEILKYQPGFLDLNVPALFIQDMISGDQLIGFTQNNILNEILGVLIIISALLVAFSREKQEDEYIAKIRMESLVWATYVNYGVLLLAFLFLYYTTFLWAMIFNMFTVLVFFIIRFNWQLSLLKKSISHEE